MVLFVYMDRLSKPGVNFNHDDIAKLAEIEQAADLTDHLGNLRREIDRQATPTVAEFSKYKFDKLAILYDYPEEIRELLNIYDSDVEEVSVTVGSQTLSPSIRVATSNIGIFEINTVKDESSESTYNLSLRASHIDFDEQEVSPESVGNLLVSMAMSSDASSYVDEVKRENKRIEKLDPRGPKTLFLIESNLAEQADFVQKVQQYQLEYETKDDASSLVLDLYVTTQNDGLECYDASLTGYESEDGYTCIFNISANCITLSDGTFESSVQGSRTVSTIDGTKTHSLNRIIAGGYLNSAVSAMGKKPVPVRNSAK